MKKILIIIICFLFLAYSQNNRQETATLIGEVNYEINEMETSEEAMINCQRRAIINALEKHFLSLRTQHILKPLEIDCILQNLINITVIEQTNSNISLFLAFITVVCFIAYLPDYGLPV